MIKINDTLIPSPTAMEISIIPIGDRSKRNALGDTVIDYICEKRRLDMAWSCLETSGAQSILSLCASPTCMIEYPDPVLGVTAKRFFVISRSAQALSDHQSRVIIRTEEK